MCLRERVPELEVVLDDTAVVVTEYGLDGVDGESTPASSDFMETSADKRT